MSRDSSATYLHMHSSRLADLFEDFCRPPSASNTATNPTANSANLGNGNGNGTTNSNINISTATGDPTTTQLPGHFLPFEEIHLPPHLMPLNPEDEDDVVPDMHAAFGITRALGQNVVGGGAEGGGLGGAGPGAQREPVWRDLGLDRLVERGPVVSTGSFGAGAGVRREGKRTGRVALR